MQLKNYVKIFLPANSIFAAKIRDILTDLSHNYRLPASAILRALSSRSDATLFRNRKSTPYEKITANLRLGLLVTALGCFGLSARAATETITTPTLIDAGDTSHDNNDLVIVGTTVTINGSHPFHSLALQSGAVVTHTAGLTAGLKLTVAQNVTIDAGAKIDVSGQGYTASAGPGGGTSGNTYGRGGAYGGNGGFSDGGAGGSGYGSILQPTD